ncbi:MAG TPA: UbiA-like polyprenyltransferase [Bacteroidia bacterium]
MQSKVGNYLSLIKFSHTIFAMPFALIGFFTAVVLRNFSIDWKLFLYVILCMVFARSAAMAFNRFIDRRFDAANKRTVVREIPSGIITPQNALMFVIINCALFIATTYLINTICFFLSPVALLVILGYSYTKRFTALCHVVLGVGLSLAPIGAWLAVTGKFDLLPVLFSFTVLFWVSGFDIIYALQDDEFDRSQRLHSIPVALGRRGALILSTVFHLISALLVVYAGFLAQFDLWYWIGTSIFIGLLVYQHLLVKPDDLSKVNLAFMTTNGIASVIFCVFVLLELFA